MFLFLGRLALDLVHGLVFFISNVVWLEFFSGHGIFDQQCQCQRTKKIPCKGVVGVKGEERWEVPHNCNCLRLANNTILVFTKNEELRLRRGSCM